MRHLISTVTAATDPTLNTSPQSETASFSPPLVFSLCRTTWFFFRFCASFSFPLSGDEEGEGTALAMSKREKAYPGQTGLCIESIRAAQTLDCHWHLPGAHFQLIFKGLHLLKPDYDPTITTKQANPRVWQKRLSFITTRLRRAEKGRQIGERIPAKPGCIFLNDFFSP